MKLLRSSDVIPLAASAALGGLALLLCYVAVTVGSRAFREHQDNNDGVYLVFAGFTLAVATVPGIFAVLIARTGGWRLVLIALPVATLFASLALFVIEDSSRRDAERHIRERQRDSSMPPALASPVGTLPPGPRPVTPSLGAPR